MELTGGEYCFVCGKKNPHGMQIDFCMTEDGRLKGEFVAGERFQGFNGILHGGILGLLLDEVMVKLAYERGLRAVSVNLKVNLRKPVRIGEKVQVVGELKEQGSRKITARGEVRRNGERVADAEALLIRF